MKINQRQLRQIIKEVMGKFTAEDGEEYFYVEREGGAGSASWEQTDAPGEVNEGMTPDQMPDSWRQILGSCLDED